MCDGHGINGHHASDHVKRTLCPNIEYIDQMAIKNRNQSGKSPMPTEKKGVNKIIQSKNQ